MRGRTLSRAFALVTAAMLIGGLVVVQQPQAAHAAAKQSVTAKKTVGSDRKVSVTLKCASTKKCKGSVKLSLSTGGTKTLNYSVAKKKSKTLSWKLTKGQYQKLTKKGSAKLKIAGTAKQPAKSKFARTATIKPAPPKLTPAQTSFEVAADRKLTVPFSCKAATGCAATAQFTISGTKSTQIKVVSSGKGVKTARFTLPAAAYAKLSETAARHTITVTETKPDRVAKTTAVSLRTTPVVQEDRAASKAFAERNWTPTEYDTCPVALHREFQTVGPDGKIYPTWHPAQVVDPATGQLCNFGHEHGADPATSEIYEWVSDFYAPADLEEGEPKGLPFGYTSEELDNHVHEVGEGAMRHEDNAGHKVFLANNVKMLDADRNWLRVDGEILTCDFLIKAHQGSHSPDATSNNAHELLYAVKCDDGTELISTILTRFGNPNEMHSRCTGAPIGTVGSNLPSGDGGKRIIPVRSCVTSNPTDWMLYEVWESDSKILAEDGSQLAYFDPWFGVRNPSRMYDTSTADTNVISRPLDLAWLTQNPARDYLWAGLADQERFDWRDPRSPFDGAQRDFYLGELQLADPGTANGVVYTDPYGAAGKSHRTVGSIAQHIKPGTVLGTTLLDKPRKFDAKADFGKDNGVHAPN